MDACIRVVTALAPQYPQFVDQLAQSVENIHIGVLSWGNKNTRQLVNDLG
jgi:hypothetical protein